MTTHHFFPNLNEVQSTYVNLLPIVGHSGRLSGRLHACPAGDTEMEIGCVSTNESGVTFTLLEQ